MPLDTNPLAGDSERDLCLKILTLQGGPQVPKQGDSIRDLLRKILINGGIGGGGGGPVAWGDIGGTLADQTDLQTALDSAGAVDSVNGQTGAVTITAAGLDVANDTGTDTNNSGNTTITPADGVGDHAHTITVGGSARTSIIILATANRVEGDKIEVVLALPTTAAIILELRNATAGGTLLETVATDGSGADAAARFRFNGTAWEHVQTTYPKAVS